jgi:hypothetical protein
MNDRPASMLSRVPEIGRLVEATPIAHAANGAQRPAFDPGEQRRRATQVEAMIADMDRVASELEREIAAEQVRSGIHDPAHFAYPTYAKAAMARRDNLRRSIATLRHYV